MTGGRYEGGEKLGIMLGGKRGRGKEWEGVGGWGMGARLQKEVVRERETGTSFRTQNKKKERGRGLLVTPALWEKKSGVPKGLSSGPQIQKESGIWLPRNKREKEKRRKGNLEAKT